MVDNRYLSQLLLPEIGTKGQEKIGKSKVLIIGCGGLAASVLPYLAAAGIGEITLMDDDLISQSNLNRQILFNDTEIGLSKAKILKQKLLLQNPKITINIILNKFTAINGVPIVEQHDLVLDCCDDYLCKIAINYCCYLTKTPWIYASVLGFDGQVALFNMQENTEPCYKCFQAKPPYNQNGCGLNGVVGAAVNLVGSYQALLALHFILGNKQNINKLFVFDLWNLDSKKFKIHKKESCAFHNEKIKNLPMIEYSSVNMLQNVQLIDIRSNEEWDLGHLPNAKHLTIGELLQNTANNFNLKQSLVIYCNQEMLSQLVVENLCDMGYNAYILQGGFKAQRKDSNGN